MIGVSLGTVTSKKHIFYNSIVLLIVSIVYTVLVAYVISLFSPFAEVNNEIAIRINPTFLDLIIALAAGTAAILIIAWPKYSNHLAGVAVAASVLPPICVTGIGLALGSSKIAIGSFILFLTNMASIIFVGITIFTMLGFYRKNDEGQVKKIEFGLIVSFIIILLLSFQLLFSLSRIIYEDTAKTQIKDTLTQEFQKVSAEISVDSVDVVSLTRSTDLVEIEANIRVPSDIEIDVSQKNEIVDKLAERLGKNINLELMIVPILKVITEDKDNTTEKDTVAQTVEEVITKKARSLSEDIIVETVALTFNDKKKIKMYEIETTLRVPEGIKITEEDKEDILFSLISELARQVELHINIIRYTKI